MGIGSFCRFAASFSQITSLHGAFACGTFSTCPGFSSLRANSSTKPIRSLPRSRSRARAQIPREKKIFDTKGLERVSSALSTFSKRMTFSRFFLSTRSRNAETSKRFGFTCSVTFIRRSGYFRSIIFRKCLRSFAIRSPAKGFHLKESIPDPCGSCQQPVLPPLLLGFLFPALPCLRFFHLRLPI